MAIKSTHAAAPQGAAAPQRFGATGVTVKFAGLTALDDVELSVSRGEIVGLIGPNGAGKTTLLNVLSGFEKPSSGSLALDSQIIRNPHPGKLARAGVARTFQNVRLFSRLTVEENVLAGALGTGASSSEAADQARELLELFGLTSRAEVRADGLPYGDERRLGIARALATRPHFLMLDEPAAGMNEAESDELMSALRDIRDDRGCAILLVEHDMRLVMGLCERLQVLDHGKTIAAGSPSEIRANAQVVEAYLGTQAHVS